VIKKRVKIRRKSLLRSSLDMYAYSDGSQLKYSDTGSNSIGFRPYWGAVALSALCRGSAVAYSRSNRNVSATLTTISMASDCLRSRKGVEAVKSPQRSAQPIGSNQTERGGTKGSVAMIRRSRCF
jgi:hypothetical protein